MVIIDIVINVLLGRVTRHPAGMHCPSWDDAFVSSLCSVVTLKCTNTKSRVAEKVIYLNMIEQK